MINTRKIIDEYKKINIFSYKSQITKIKDRKDLSSRNNTNILTNYFHPICSGLKNVLCNFTSDWVLSLSVKPLDQKKKKGRKKKKEKCT